MSSIQALRSDLSPLLLFAPPPLPAPARPALLLPRPAPKRISTSFLCIKF